MEFVELPIVGCYLIKARKINDERGSFCKLFHCATFVKYGLESKFAESYISCSHRGVIRGMHFQLPPADHAKLVCCLSGRVRDGLVDLRRGSPTYKQSYSLTLSSEKPQLIYVARGVAHGFAALENNTIMWYLVSAAHDSNADYGVHLDSVGINWWEGYEMPEKVIVSSRDQSFPRINEFNSPFVFNSSSC